MNPQPFKRSPTEVSVPRLSRLTTEYVALEDRIRISGELGDKSVALLWLTQRLLNRLVPELVQWLESHEAPEATPRPELVQSFKQQAAQRKHQVSAATEPPVASALARVEWLIESVDLSKADNRLRLTFKGSETGMRAQIDFTPVLLRQWLAVLIRGAYKGEWMLAAWPQWLTEQLNTQAKLPVSQMH